MRGYCIVNLGSGVIPGSVMLFSKACSLCTAVFFDVVMLITWPMSDLEQQQQEQQLAMCGSSTRSYVHIGASLALSTVDGHNHTARHTCRHVIVICPFLTVMDCVTNCLKLLTMYTWCCCKRSQHRMTCIQQQQLYRQPCGFQVNWGAGCERGM
jgi:hypothetical protein